MEMERDARNAWMVVVVCAILLQAGRGRRIVPAICRRRRGLARDAERRVAYVRTEERT